MTSRFHPAVVSSLLIALLAGCAADRTSRKAVDPAVQRSVGISRGWQFIRKDVDGAAAAGFDDKAWTSVDLPHTWNLADGSDGGSNYYRGPGWYRKHLAIGTAQANQRLFLRFGAASLVADVYVNGEVVGQHRGGFAAFCFDVTGKLHVGDNVIAVRVSNARAPDIAPLSGDFTVFGGLYRDVELLTLDPMHISPMDDASPGVYVRQSAVSADSVTLDITAKLQNDDGRPTQANFDVVLKTADHQTVARKSTAVPIAAHGSVDATCRIVLPKPHLWNGLSDPYQYSVQASVGNAEAKTDAVTVPLGVRTFAIEAHRGFLLNDKPYPLLGVNIHQEVAGKGWAAGPADQEQAYGIVQDLGANAVRMAHYQHFDYEYSLCDREGLVVWTEAPLVNRIGDDPKFADVTKQQLRELIKQQYNHPSIALWGMFNEVSNKQSDPHWSLIHELNDLAHELDPTRLTTGAINIEANLPLNRWTDATALNRYTGWYEHQAAEWPDTVNENLLAINTPATQPTNQAVTRATTRATTQPTTLPSLRAIACSEYGAGGSIRQHEVNPPRPRPDGGWHPEEYQAIVHEQAYRAMTARPEIWGTFVWVMFDFSADYRHEGDTLGRNDKGLVTFDRAVRKDAFYFYQANWSKTPFVHITSKRYQPHPAGPMDIKIYSNCDSVELMVNGKSLGTVTNDHGTFVWPGVLFTGKTLTASATGTKGNTKGGQIVTDEMTWTIDPTATTHPAPTTKPSGKASTKPKTPAPPTTNP
ncbi:MAG: putative glycosyl hydrolase [Phycisphaerales bacterium]|nr:putative glycosyl hydrolase [Phycisphaerales bacterium]